MKNNQEIKQYVSFSQEDFSSDMKNNIVHATDSTGKTVAVDTWKYARYFFDKIQRKDISKESLKKRILYLLLMIMIKFSMTTQKKTKEKLMLSYQM